jgi:hypothetical protein
MDIWKKFLPIGDTRKCSGIENENGSYFLRKALISSFSGVQYAMLEISTLKLDGNF